MTGFEPIVTAVRVFTTRNRRPKEEPEKPKRRKRRYPFEVLVFDTETTVDPSQNLLVGVWRFYRDDPDGRPGDTCIEEGIFYPDHLPDSDPDGFATLQQFASTRSSDVAPGFARGDGLLLWPESYWKEERLYRYGFRHRNRCAVVGFNLLFDFGRIASYWTPGRGNFLGGWSLGLWGRRVTHGRWKNNPFRPRLRAKSIDPRRTLFAWGTVQEDDDAFLKGSKGQFVDLRTLAFALSDKSYTLESACRAFGVEFTKAKVEYGVISEPLLTYARKDVEATANLYRALLDELDQHQGVDLEPHRLYSPATVGVQYLKAMGVEPPMARFEIPDEIHGWAMCGFYGGRVEARIVRTPVPIAYVDATSMYPTVNALLDTWSLLTAEHLRSVDVTADVEGLLADPDVLYEHCFDREFWRGQIGVTLVEVDHPDGDLLPVRGEYDELASDPGIGLNPYRYDGTIWYPLPDLINSTISTRQPTPIRQAIRLTPEGVQAGLTPVALRGGEKIDPACEDPFKAFIEYRHQTKQDHDLPPETRGRLDQFLKITANATAYGVLARFDRRRFSQPKTVTVYGPDEPFTTNTKTPEDPGPYCFPPVAATITAGPRLLLGMLEREVTDAGGNYVFCDTDSMGIVSSTDPTPIPCETEDGTNKIIPMTPEQVKGILDRFEPLNPYDPDLIPRLWTEEHDSINNPIWCYSISSKRYVLYRTDNHGKIEIVDWSEHGLGQYLNPLGDRDDSGRDEDGRHLWARQAWEWVLTGDGRRDTMPDWVHLPAVTRFSLSTPATSIWFTGYNRSQPRSKRIRPSSFGILAHTDTLIHGSGENTPRPTAVYNPNPDQWLDLDWYDRTNGQPIQITTSDPHNPLFNQHLGEGRIRVKTLGDVLAEFRLRPEHKSLAPDGTPATSRTKGLLQRRPIESAPVLTDLIGKEGNELDERGSGVIIDPADYRSQYGNRGDRWTQLVLPILRSLGVEEIMKRTGRKKSVVYEVLAGREAKYGGPAVVYRDVAVEAAQDLLRSEGHRPVRHPFGCLYLASRLVELESSGPGDTI